MVDRKRRLDCANGIRKADIVLKHGKVLNVFTEEILEADVAICGDTIVGVGSYEGEREIDCTGKYLVPGFLDAHMHIESSMVSPGELSKVLVQAGTTTIVADPHEIVNVCGVKGMDYFLKCAGKALVHIFFMIPSSVPATDVETNGCGEFLASDMMKYVDDARVLGLGETMRFVECYQGERRMSDKLELFAKKHIDGHAPGITGKAVQAYRLAGVENDHECANSEEVLDKLRAGFHIYIREGSGAKNLETLIRTLLDANVALDKLNEWAEPKKTAEWQKQIKAWDEENPLGMRRDKGMTPQMIMEHINKNYKDAIYVTDVGQHQMWATQYLELDSNSQLLTSGGLGTMGFGLPAAIGAKIANPDKEVVCISGDGGLQMNIQELATSVVQGAGVTICVLNNYYLGMVRQMQQLFYGKRYSATCLRRRKGCPAECKGPNEACPPYTPDFLKLVESYGGHGIRVEKEEDIDAAFAEAKKYKDVPVIIEFMIATDEIVLPMVKSGNPMSEMILK